MIDTIKRHYFSDRIVFSDQEITHVITFNIQNTDFPSSKTVNCCYVGSWYSEYSKHRFFSIRKVNSWCISSWYSACCNYYYLTSQFVHILVAIGKIWIHQWKPHLDNICYSYGRSQIFLQLFLYCVYDMSAVWFWRCPGCVDSDIRSLVILSTHFNVHKKPDMHTTIIITLIMTS